MKIFCSLSLWELNEVMGVLGSFTMNVAVIVCAGCETRQQTGKRVEGNGGGETCTGLNP